MQACAASRSTKARYCCIKDGKATILLDRQRKTSALKISRQVNLIGKADLDRKLVGS
jgi:hypothetical protein